MDSLPLAQSVHLEVPPCENMPAVQSTQWSFDDVGEVLLPCLPGGQALQVDGSDAPWAELKVPTEQVMHDFAALVCLVTVLYVPAGQAVHDDAALRG